MIQIELYLPPPITAHQAAAILGKLGGQARAVAQRKPILERAAQIRDELHLPPSPALNQGER